MSRLPVSDNSSGKWTAPLAANVSWGGLALVAALGAVWWIGVTGLDGLLGIDTQCEGERYDGRGAEAREFIRSALEAGVAGWIYLAWVAIFPFGLVTWLERRLRKAMLARRQIVPRD